MKMESIVRFDAILSVFVMMVFSFVVYTYQQDRASITQLVDINADRSYENVDSLRQDVRKLQDYVAQYDVTFTLLDRRLLSVEMIVQSNNEAIAEIRALREDIQRLKWQKDK